MKLINAGIPDAGMPAHTFSPAQLASLVAYLRNMRNMGGASVRLGNAGRGKAVFEGSGQCTSCHRVNGQGARSAPDLSNIGALRTAEVLRGNVVTPNTAMFPINRPVRAVTQEGTVIAGRRLNEDPFTVQLIDDQGRLVSLIKAELREYVIQKQSPMPSYQGKLTEDELADLLSYLLSLKGL